MSEAVKAIPWCPQCGPVSDGLSDEDGCCLTCGATVGLVPDWTEWRDRATRAEAALAAIRDPDCKIRKREWFDEQMSEALRIIDELRREKEKAEAECSRLASEVERLRSLLRKAKEYIPAPSSCWREETAEYLEWLHRAIEEAIAPIGGVVTATDASKSVLDERSREMDRLWACLDRFYGTSGWTPAKVDAVIDAIRARDLPALCAALGIEGGK